MANWNAPWNKGLAGSDKVKLSRETKRKMNLSHTGTKKSAEVRQKIGESNKGKHNTKVVCPKCGICGGISIMKRWHFEKCGTRNRSEFQKYLRRIHQLTSEIYKEHKQVINPHQYPRTKCGVEGGYQLDHKISVKDGFEKKIPVCEIAHINNLQMLPWKENRAKGA